MRVQTWWPLFPLLFLVVLTCLITALLQLARRRGSRLEWITSAAALLFYFLTFALGRWRWLHMPMSNIAEVLMLYNVLHFSRRGRGRIAWLNAGALAAILADFTLHLVLRR